MSPDSFVTYVPDRSVDAFATALAELVHIVITMSSEAVRRDRRVRPESPGLAFSARFQDMRRLARRDTPRGAARYRSMSGALATFVSTARAGGELRREPSVAGRIGFRADRRKNIDGRTMSWLASCR